MNSLNNCSTTPIWNRSKRFFRRSSTITPVKCSIAKKSSTKPLKITECGSEIICSNSSVRSLAKFYDSIPDYCDINHLPEDEFYSTLDSLKSTCQQLKTTVIPNICRTSSQSNNSTSSCTVLSKGLESKKTKSKSKCTKKKTAKKMEHNKKDIQKYCCNNKQDIKDSSETSSSCIPVEKNICNDTSEIDRLRKKPTRKSISDVLLTDQQLKKSFSCNDLHALALSYKNGRIYNLEKANSLPIKDCTNSINHIPPKIEKLNKEKNTNDAITKNIFQSRNFSKLGAFENQNSERKKAFRSTFLSLFQPNKDKRYERCLLTTPSPIHPVARPNLAANLRAEVSKKKLKELQNKCTYQDTITPIFDWGVRKTPAWKTLSLNETHQEILLTRLATRKAEQALQKRQYNMNMDLMRQRVKSAPLLLEGNTHWSPNVGKLSHTCQTEGQGHICKSIERKQMRKPIVESSSKECSLIGCKFCNSDANSRLSNSIKTLRRIYLGSSKSSDYRKYSGQKTKRTEKSAVQKQQHRRDPKKSENIITSDLLNNYSDDELSSMDRALL